MQHTCIKFRQFRYLYVFIAKRLDKRTDLSGELSSFLVRHYKSSSFSIPPTCIFGHSSYMHSFVATASAERNLIRVQWRLFSWRSSDGGGGSLGVPSARYLRSGFGEWYRIRKPRRKKKEEEETDEKKFGHWLIGWRVENEFLHHRRTSRGRRRQTGKSIFVADLDHISTFDVLLMSMCLPLCLSLCFCDLMSFSVRVNVFVCVWVRVCFGDGADLLRHARVT